MASIEIESKRMNGKKMKRTSEKKMRRVVVVGLSVLLGIVGTLWVKGEALAASQAECAIWLCLPGRFPSGCEAAKRAFHRRLDRDLAPLPRWSQCAVNGAPSANLTYQLGSEPYFPCEEGFTLVMPNRGRQARCVQYRASHSPESMPGEENDWIVELAIPAKRRPNGGRYIEYFENDNPIEVTDEVGGDVYSRFFY